MNRQFRAAAIGLAIAACSGLSFAQFSAPSLPGMGGGSKTAGVSAEALVKSYVAGAQLVLKSNAKFSAALGLKELAEKTELHAKNLTEGATSSGLEDAAKVQTEGSKAQADAMNSDKVVLTAEGKKTFALGLVDLAGGMASYAGMASDLKSFKPSPTSLGSSAGAAMYVAKSLPQQMTELKDTLTRSVAFAKKNDIAVSDQVSKFL